MELTIFTHIGINQDGKDELWRIRAVERTLQRFNPPRDTKLVLADNTRNGVDVLALKQYIGSVEVVKSEPSIDACRGPARTEGTIRRAKECWPLFEGQFVFNIDADTVPMATYTQMREIIDGLPQCGILSLLCRLRTNFGKTVNQTSIGGERPFIRPTELCRVERTGSAAILMRHDVMRDMTFEGDGGCIWEAVFTNHLAKKNMEWWAAGNLPLCRHYIDATHYIGETPNIEEDKS